jgi:hypothetical protein
MINWLGLKRAHFEQRNHLAPVVDTTCRIEERLQAYGFPLNACEGKPKQPSCPAFRLRQ